MPLIQELFSNLHFLVCSSAIVALGLSLRMYPVIIYVAHKKRLTDVPEDRKSHFTEVPNLGGVGLFISFSLAIILYGMAVGLNRPELIKLLSIFGATMILLFLGIKDDLVLLSPKKKFVGQFIAAGMVIFMPDVRIQSFDGLLGVGELPYIASVVFTFFVFLLVVNAYNLIDGIDGLAGTIALISSLLFGIFFVVNDQLLLALVSFVLIGSVIGFLRYNFSKTHKLFMGDSGSLFIGYLLAYQGISFLVVNESASSTFTIANAPMVLLAILSFPLLDTLRVFIIRAREKRSPFSADRNHIHHRLLNLGLSHKRATFVIALINLTVIGLVLLMGNLYINVQLIISVSFGVFLYLLPYARFFENRAPVKVKSSLDEEKNMRIATESFRPVQKAPQSQKTQIAPTAYGGANTNIKTFKVEADERKVHGFRRRKVTSKRWPAIKNFSNTTNFRKKVGER